MVVPVIAWLLGSHPSPASRYPKTPVQAETPGPETVPQAPHKPLARLDPSAATAWQDCPRHRDYHPRQGRGDVVTRQRSVGLRLVSAHPPGAQGARAVG